MTLSLLQAILEWKGSGRLGLEVLRHCGVNTDELESEVKEAVRRQIGQPASRQSVQTQLYEIVDLARQESRDQQVNYVGTEHLVLGLLRKSEEPPAMLLANRGVTPELFRVKLAERLKGDK